MREAVEMVDGRLYWSDDHWQTVWKRKAGHWRDGWAVSPSVPVTGEEADRARYIGIVAHGGGRDDRR